VIAKRGTEKLLSHIERLSVMARAEKACAKALFGIFRRAGVHTCIAEAVTRVWSCRADFIQGNYLQIACEDISLDHVAAEGA